MSRCRVLPTLMLSTLLLSCSSSQMQGRHEASLRTSLLQASVEVHAAQSAAAVHIQQAHHQRIDASLAPFLHAERGLSDAFLQCREEIGAVADASVGALERCQASLRTAQQNLASKRLEGLGEDTGYDEALAGFYASSEAFLEARTTSYRRARSHTLYAEMVEAYNRWVEASQSLRAWITTHPHEVLSALLAAEREATQGTTGQERDNAHAHSL